MRIILSALAGISLGVITWQLVIWIGEIRDKNRKYKSAAARVREVGKPLLVAGGPWGNMRIRHLLNMPAHGSGHVCIDIDRCAFDGHPCGLIADVTQIPFSDNSFGAAFASHLLEHLATVDDAKRALSELDRVAESVFVAYPSRQSIGAWIKSDHHLWVWQKDHTTYLEQRGDSKDRHREEYRTDQQSTSE